VRRVDKKLFSLSLTRLIPNFSRLTAKLDVLAHDLPPGIHAQMIWSPRLSTSNEITFVSGTMIDRTFRLCGATGVITKLADSGNMIGPLQLILYP
jgi:hypothetical protein